MVVAFEERHESIGVGKEQLLTLVVRNDGELVSEPVALVDTLPADWRILGASVSKGLVSISGREVRVNLGGIRPGEQIIVAITVQAPSAVQPDSAQHCVSLSSAEQSEVCAALPAVVMAERDASGDVETGSPEAEAPERGTEFSLLGDTTGAGAPGQSGATLVVHNRGATADRGVYLYLELGDGWRLSDVLTTLGLVSVVDHTAVVRIGRLDAGELVAVTLRGWRLADQSAPFCVTLVVDGQARRRECGALATGQSSGFSFAAPAGQASS